LNQAFIIGFGKFGKLALKQRVRLGDKTRVWIIDSRPEPLNQLEPGLFSVIKVLADGPQFLTQFQDWIGDEDWIIPALPIHLAWKWLELNLKTSKSPKALVPPKRLGSGLPFHQVNNKGLLLSYADFECPEDCPAPLAHCFKTHKKKALPLWKFIAEQRVMHGTLVVIESRQIAPGVGGYAFKELRKIREMALKAVPPFFVATACRCHGVIHGTTWEE
jgi:hypothetical protein